MALDNSAYESLEKTYFKIKHYLETTKLGPEHSNLIMKHEELIHLIEDFDIEALEEQTKQVDILHNKLHEITTISEQLSNELDLDGESIVIAQNSVSMLDQIFEKIKDLSNE